MKAVNVTPPHGKQKSLKFLLVKQCLPFKFLRCICKCHVFNWEVYSFFYIQRGWWVKSRFGVFGSMKVWLFFFQASPSNEMNTLIWFLERIFDNRLQVAYNVTLWKYNHALEDSGIFKSGFVMRHAAVIVNTNDLCFSLWHSWPSM